MLSNDSFQLASMTSPMRNFALLGPLYGTQCSNLVKEQLNVHRRIIACEAPPMVHAGTCTKQKQCEDNWKQVLAAVGGGTEWVNFYWTNKISSPTRMPSDHERKLITRTADDLVKYLIVDPNFEDFGRLVH